jgi:hypothetical protein
MNVFINTVSRGACLGSLEVAMSLSQPMLDAPAVFRAPSSKRSAPLRVFARSAIPVRPLIAAVAALGIGAPVAALFVPVAFSRASQPIVTLVCLLAAIGAPTFTFLTALQAQSSKSTRGAVGLTLLGCVAPPAALFALTLYGLVFAVPAGLLAFGLVVPLVLGARRVAARDSADAVDRVLAGSAAWLALIGALVLYLERLSLGERTWGPLPLAVWGALPLLAGALFAASVAARDLARLVVVTRASTSSAHGLASRAPTPADATLPQGCSRAPPSYSNA